MKENEEIERENQVLMEQLERVTNFKVAGSGGDALLEVVDECEKAKKLQTIKENRLRRLRAAHEDKKFNVENARALAIKAQKDRIEGEIKSMEEEAKQVRRRGEERSDEADDSTAVSYSSFCSSLSLCRRSWSKTSSLRGTARRRL